RGRVARALAGNFRSDLRRDLCARSGGAVDRPHGLVGEFRRPGAVAPARVRHAAPCGHDTQAGGRHARRRRIPGQRSGACGGRLARLADQSDPDLRRQSSILSLGHGPASALWRACRILHCAAGTGFGHSPVFGAACDEQRCDARRAGGLVMRRRDFLALAGASLCLPFAVRAQGEYPLVTPRSLVFPRDHGAHPAFRTAWWYITGWLGEERGSQLTFFRNRPGVAEDNPSAFAPKQLLFAHAAVSDARQGRLLHDQRVVRAGFGLAEAREDDTDVRIGDWWLRRTESGYRTRIAAQDFAFELSFRSTQPLLLQGEAGFSSKGPRPEEASYYYSRPHLAAAGRLRLGDEDRAVEGRAWLDHEWSSEYLSRDAAGWDWTGLNLDDGAALMAFCIRGKDGGTYWAGATY